MGTPWKEGLEVLLKVQACNAEHTHSARPFPGSPPPPDAPREKADPMKILLLLAAAGAVVLGLGSTGGRPESASEAPRLDEPEPLHLTFGVYPTDKATVMYRMFTPLLESLAVELEKELERPVDIELTIFRSYDQGIDALCDGGVDFVHFGPASYITAKERNPDLQLIAMEHESGQKRFQGVIFVRHDSPIQTLAQLEGKSFAFGDPNSTIGRWLVQAELVRAGLRVDDFSKVKYHERHDQVAAVVEHGDFDAGSVKSSTFEKANLQNTLRSIATFENVTKPIVARAGLPAEVSKAIQIALFRLSDPSIFKDLKISGFMAARDDDYKFVRDGMKKARAFEGKRGG
jgi:phosphonate transport system substrate-binding protein